MAELPVPAPQLVTEQDPTSRVTGGDVQRSADYAAQAGDRLASGLGQLSAGLEDAAVPLAQQAGQDAVAKAVTRNPDGSLNVTTPASSFILGKAGNAYRATVEAGTGAALRSNMDADITNIRQQHQGDAAGFRIAAGQYIDQLATKNPGDVGAMVQQYGNGLAAQTYDGIVNQKASLDVKASLDAQQGRVTYLENAMNGLAADGGASTPQFAQMRSERDALLNAKVANPLAAYNSDQKTNDDAVFTQSLGIASAVGHGRRLYESTGNLQAATQATQDDLNSVDGLSEGQKIRAMGEVSAHLRGLDATRQQGNQEITDQANALITQSAATGNVPATTFETLAQQLEGRRLFAKAALVRAQSLNQQYQPAIIGGTAQEATNALNQVISTAATRSQGAGGAGTAPPSGAGAATAAYMNRLFQIEDPSGDPNAVSPTGAKGLGQFTAKTWARYGNGGDPFNPADNAAAVVRLTNANAAAMTNSLGRAPTYGELYLAHQQGAAGAAALLSDPSANAAQALSLAYGGDIGKAYNAIKVNGGDPGGTAGQFASKWINKFQGGIQTPGQPAGAFPDGGPSMAYSALLKDAYASYNVHASKLWAGIQDAYDKGFAPTPAETADLRTMAPNITDPTLRQTISDRLQKEAAKATFATLPLAQQQDAVAAGTVLAQQGGMDNVQRQTLTTLAQQVQHQSALAKDDPVTYGQRYISPNAQGGLSPIAPLNLSTPDGFEAAIRSRQAIKGAAQKMDPAVGDMPFTGSDKDQIVSALQQGQGPQVAAIMNGMATNLTNPEMTAVSADDNLRNAIIGNARSTDPAKVAAAFTFLRGQYMNSPGTFEHRFPGVLPDMQTWQ